MLPLWVWSREERLVCKGFCDNISQTFAFYDWPILAKLQKDGPVKEKHCFQLVES